MAAQRYLFQISIGPVQAFIASARRTRDLWYGSWLLSELSRAAATTLRDTYHAALIFPAPGMLAQSDGDGTIAPASIANKIVASIETDDIAACGEAITEAVRTKLRALREDAFRHVRWTTTELGDADRTLTEQQVQDMLELAEQQVEDMLECYWAAVPFSTNTYGAARDRLEHAMAARKATRAFTQVQLTAQQGHFPKSSLDGQRESVIPEKRYPARGDTPQQRRTKLQRLYRDFGAKHAERLSGVDLLKRLGKHTTDEADFPSTSHFAALPFLQRLEGGTTSISAAFATYRAKLEQYAGQAERLAERYRQYLPSIDGYDASIIFESRLAEEVHKVDFDAARGALHEFFDAAAGQLRPQPYYALLHADGDSMGTVIDNQEDENKHRDLSQQLAVFAGGVRAIVEAQRGALVYAGGDDVLAFLPIDTVLVCAEKLHTSFAGQVGNGAFASKDGTLPTLSVGIAICHHLEPLSEALALVRRAEQRAKHATNAAGRIVKNGLAIAVEKRSGEPQMIAGCWADGFYERLQQLVTLMRDDELSAGAPYELRDLTERLGEPKQLNLKDMLRHRAVAEEAARIIARKRGQRGNKQQDDATFNDVRGWLGLPEKRDGKLHIPEHGDRYKTQHLTVRQLADELIVAREFARYASANVAQGGAQS